MLRRAPSDNWLTPEWQEKMAKIEDCLHCNQCMSKCPYGLHTPDLLAKNYEDYKKVLAGEVSVESRTAPKRGKIFDRKSKFLNDVGGGNCYNEVIKHAKGEVS